MRTIVYVDGFNLYYGALRKTNLKWLDLDKLVRILLPGEDIQAIKYFTAIVKARPTDPHLAIRQQIYLRALRTRPTIEIILGHFLDSDCWMPLKNPPSTGSRFVHVMKTEEKGSDVNIATHLLCDAFRGKCDRAVLITNDSDLCSPVQVVTKDLGISVGIINPHKKPSRELQNLASSFVTLKQYHLQQSQFPATLHDAVGTITKPSSW